MKGATSRPARRRTAMAATRRRAGLHGAGAIERTKAFRVGPARRGKVASSSGLRDGRPSNAVAGRAPEFGQCRTKRKVRRSCRLLGDDDADRQAVRRRHVPTPDDDGGPGRSDVRARPRSASMGPDASNMTSNQPLSLQSRREDRPAECWAMSIRPRGAKRLGGIPAGRGSYRVLTRLGRSACRARSGKATMGTEARHQNALAHTARPAPEPGRAGTPQRAIAASAMRILSAVGTALHRLDGLRLWAEAALHMGKRMADERKLYCRGRVVVAGPFAAIAAIGGRPARIDGDPLPTARWRWLGAHLSA